jgi:phage terminase large subunit-like protein
MRFILWWYAIDARGRFIYREGVLQRLKGWGKDPLAAVIAAVELVGPCRFMGWTTRRRPDLGLEIGDPIGKSHPRAWIQIAAVSKDQTKNTMTLFPGLFTQKCKDLHGITIGKEIVYAYAGARRIEAVTSSPATLEGGRPTLVIMNETHHWKANNDGHAMSDVISRNARKSKGGAARRLAITNAYEPSEDSVAQRRRETWEEQEAGLAIKTGILYDSLEAPPDATMRPAKVRNAEGKLVEPTEEEVREHLAAIIRGVRGDAWWLDIDSLVDAILDKETPVSQSRRFWFNQIVAAEDAWLDPAAIKKAIDPLVAANREIVGKDDLKVGWRAVMPDEDVVMFFDGSKSDDATAIVGCRVSDSYIFTIGVWQKPKGERGKTWLVPRHAVDKRVREAFDTFRVVGFWADPSHATDDTDGTRYWDELIDTWHRDFNQELKIWATKSGLNTHSVMFDLASPERQRLFVGAAEEFVEQMESKDDIEEFDPQFKIDGHPALVAHMRNARRYPTKFGNSLMKDNRESARKIDLAVAAVGARLLRRSLLNGEKPEEKRSGEVWGAW